MDVQREEDLLKSRIRQVEDENQELRAQVLTQNRTIAEMRSEIASLRLQLNEMSDTSSLLTDRVRQLSQQSEDHVGTITVPPLMAPPPVPPPLPPPRIRISPRQVGAGEAITTPLGVSMSTPPRHRAKRDHLSRRTSRSPLRRNEAPEPGPSSQGPLPNDRPNYFLGLSIVPQFQNPFRSSQAVPISSPCVSSTSDQSDSDDDSLTNLKDHEFFRKPPSSRDYENRCLRHKAHRAGLHAGLPLPRVDVFYRSDTLPSTSAGAFTSGKFVSAEDIENNSFHFAKRPKVSNCVQYTFPNLHEGLHHSGVQNVVTSIGLASRSRKHRDLENFPRNELKEISNSSENDKGLGQQAEDNSESVSSTESDSDRNQKEKKQSRKK